MEFESSEPPQSPGNEESWGAAGSSRVMRVPLDDSSFGRPPRKPKGATVAGEPTPHILHTPHTPHTTMWCFVV